MDDIDIFYTGYNKLNETQKSEFSKIVNKILRCNYLTNQIEEDKEDFYKLIDNFEIYFSYFSLMDYEIVFHRQTNVIALTNLKNYNHRNFKKNESILLLILRKLYFKKMQSVSVNENVAVTIEEIHDEIMLTGLFEKRYTKTELTEYISTFKRYKIITNIGKIENDDTIVILFKPLLHVIDVATIDELDQKIKSFSTNEVIDEKIS